MSSSPAPSSTEVSRTDPSVEPMMFAAGCVPDLGEFTGQGILETAIAAALEALTAMNVSFSVPALTFTFNRTPALVQTGDSVATVVVDWAARRRAYQRAKGLN